MAPLKRTSAGWAFSIVLDPAVEYRVWPIATGPDSVRIDSAENLSETSPMARRTFTAPSLTATIPADS